MLRRIAAMQRRDFLLQAALLLLSLPAAATGREKIVGLPCEGCDAVFVDLPERIPGLARITPAGEPGEPLQLRGQVRDAAGKPAAGIIIYAYQTDASGEYPPLPATRGTPAQAHGRLRSWARTDADGRYGFDSIRPGGYPGRKDPQHIHLQVIEPGARTYYIDDVVFEDDPRMADPSIRSKLQHATHRGGSGVTRPQRDAAGVWQVQRDVRLGMNIPGY